MDIRRALLVALSATPLTGCPTGGNCGPDSFDLDQPVSADELDGLLGRENVQQWDELTCESVCEMAWGTPLDSISACTLRLPEGEDGSGRVTCAGTYSPACGGRRPIGHLEGGDTECPSPLGRALAEMAYLEAASVVAFEQLAERLTRWGAPAQLVKRCRSAAADERNHARWTTRLAGQQGARVPAPRHDSVEASLFAEAMHNAVEGCVHETFAALVAMDQARSANDPLLRRIFTRIAVDEGAHAQLAWDLHEWFRERLDQDQASAIDRARAGALKTLPGRVARATAREGARGHRRSLSSTLSQTLAA
jgi:rubrerythrin